MLAHCVDCSPWYQWGLVVLVVLILMFLKMPEAPPKVRSVKPRDTPPPEPAKDLNPPRLCANCGSWGKCVELVGPGRISAPIPVWVCAGCLVAALGIDDEGPEPELVSAEIGLHQTPSKCCRTTPWVTNIEGYRICPVCRTVNMQFNRKTGAAIMPREVVKWVEANR